MKKARSRWRSGSRSRPCSATRTRPRGVGAAPRGGRAAERLQGQAALRAPAAGQAAERGGADVDATLRHDWRRLGISAEEVREFCVWRNGPMRVLSSP